MACSQLIKVTHHNPRYGQAKVKGNLHCGWATLSDGDVVLMVNLVIYSNMP